MGVNSSKRLAAKCSFLTKDEQVVVSNSFRLASKNSEKIKEDELIKLWGSQMDPRLAQYITNYLFGNAAQAEGAGGGKQTTVEFERFAELFVATTRGTADERLAFLISSLPADQGGDVPYVLVKEFVESVVSSYMKIQKASNSRQFKSWHSRGCFTSPQNVQRLAESVVHELVADNERITHARLSDWARGSTLLAELLRHVFGHLYRISHRAEKERERTQNNASVAYFPHEDYAAGGADSANEDTGLVPICRGLDLIPSYPSLLDLNQLVFIDANLPNCYRYEWRFLFSSEIHGESFSTLIGRIVEQGPSVLIVEDRNGHMFGGFAPVSWTLSPRWVGDETSFLFTLNPKMRVFRSSGYNDHYMYLNLHQQTMPNGLAMGGQHGFCGLWLDSEYGTGHTSESCTTFKGYFQMSHSKSFSFRHLEVWGLGPPPPSPHESGERQTGASVLDQNAESKKMLEMAGRQIYSEGLREPSPT